MLECGAAEDHCQGRLAAHLPVSTCVEALIGSSAQEVSLPSGLQPFNPSVDAVQLSAQVKRRQPVVWSSNHQNTNAEVKATPAAVDASGGHVDMARRATSPTSR